MATSPEAVRGELALVTAAVTQEILSVTSSVALEQQVDAALDEALRGARGESNDDEDGDES